MIQDTVVIGGECSLETRIEGDCDLTSMVEGDPDVLVVEGGGQTYPHYQGDYTVAPSTTEQVLDTDGKVMDDDVTIEAVPQGSATTPATIITADPTISVSSGGLITATVSKTQQITPTVQEGYVEEGTPGNVGVSGSNTQQLTTQGAQTIHPASTDQSIASGKYLTGAQTIKGVTVSGLTADKVLQGTTVEIGDADDSDRIMKVVGTASGGITPTGTKQITSNGTNIDVYSYQYADVVVPNSYSAGDEGKVVSNGALVSQTSDTVTENGIVDTTLIDELTVNVSGGGGFTVNDILNKTVSQTNVVWDGTGTLQYASLYGFDIETIVFSNISTIQNCANMLRNITALKSFSAPNLTSFQSSTDFMNGCTNLESINMPKINSLSNCDRFAQGCSKLTTVHLENCTNMGGNTFNGCTSLVTIVLPKSSMFYANNFYGCTSLQTADILGSDRINGGVFQNCTVFNKLIIRRTGSVCPLTNINAFNGTPFASGGTGGEIYVPSALLSTYKTSTNWSTLDGYGTVTWKAIEGSYYETHYADGTVIA